MAHAIDGTTMIPPEKVFPECPVQAFARVYGCKGRIFGGWSRCPHGYQGRLAEIEKEAAEIRAHLSTLEPSPIVTVHGRVIDGQEVTTTVRREKFRVLNNGDRIVAYPCDVTINELGAAVAVGRCSTCDNDTHIIDRRRYENGDGPWAPA